ncbi:conserved hypothetical protein [Pediculus humanus corporis]|uniref:Uncharacterized protein n=1 Tax=Pediculus humanus subsp. corporis TaxID=121224 RepID=E0W244_PEDHC|nr:uncharacterized protein Phum_PHUM584040 [Pediculus humanus corporis]EEB19700.1 conserved hypothetical protein [Pediculus humanus corporis]
MLTRREKLLTRPWQLRRYNYHKKKLVNAVSVIDIGPPAERDHVTIKLKKLQKERERQMKIEDENFILLQHLGSIMSKKRVDNYWEKEPPTFLRRVSIYHKTRSPSPCLEISPESTPKKSTRKLKCSACTPQPEKITSGPEERIPWAPPKKILTKRLSKSAVCPVLSDFDFPKIHQKSISTKSIEKSNKNYSESSIQKFSKKDNNDNNNKCEIIEKNSNLPFLNDSKTKKNVKSDQSVILRQGKLKIIVNFPSFAEIKVLKGKTEKYLQRNFCECKSFQSVK